MINEASTIGKVQEDITTKNNIKINRNTYYRNDFKSSTKYNAEC